MEDFQEKRISVIGAARSGIAAAGALVRLGAKVLLADSKALAQLGEENQREIEATGAPFVSGTDLQAILPPGTALVVTSPGVPRTADVLQEAVRHGIPVWSEIELAYRLTDVPIVAITGTNGKTTTTLLIAAMLQQAGQNALVAGNISADAIKRTLVEAALTTRVSGVGRWALGEKQKGREQEKGKAPSPNYPTTQLPNYPTPNPLLPTPYSLLPILVAEISSFQLEWVERFAPKVAVLTNITPDHLNRHASFEEYAQTKARIFAAQSGEDWAVLNYDDAAARAIGEAGLTGRRLWFTRNACPPDAGPVAWVQDGVITVRLERGGEAVPILPASELPFTLPGAHSVENVLAASAAALAMGASVEAIAEAARTFPGVAHRMEFVAEIAGVRYINNSMCTNIAAAIQSLRAMDRPTIVIAGGAEKGLDFAPLAPALREKARHLILIGAAAGKMEAVFRAAGYDAISHTTTLEEAVLQAQHKAQPGEAVLLSPACASFDMFRDFEARGVAFREAVRALREKTV